MPASWVWCGALLFVLYSKDASHSEGEVDWGQDREEGPGPGRAIRRGLGECEGGKQRHQEDNGSPGIAP